jgi:meiotically up-regulated gene 157 (Mug157) protein
MSKIVVASDQHLGYENSNADDFKNFLDYILTKRNDIQSFILLGDLVDMWRRDASGIFLEFSWMINQLLNIRNSKRIEIYIVAGNHDYHLLKLHGSSYLFKFYPKLPDSLSPSTAATQNNTINPLSQVINNKYIFKHGWEFDSAQHPIIMDWMCHNMSSDNGHVESNIYNILQTLRGRLDVELRELIDYTTKEVDMLKIFCCLLKKDLSPLYQRWRRKHIPLLMMARFLFSVIPTDHLLVATSN